MLVCIDKITSARMHALIMPRWQAKLAAVQAAALAGPDAEKRVKLDAQAKWIGETIIGLIISEAQNEVPDFKKWGFDIIPHRALIKQGFETPDGKRLDVESAFKKPEHPFRVAVVCAMWLTGFDVECLSTLYIDKPMKAHTLMQAIARANRVYPGKDFGLIVDYNGMLKSLREALAQYALGDEGGGAEEIVAPIEERVRALLAAIEETEADLLKIGFDTTRMIGAKGFTCLAAIADGVEAVISARDEGRRRVEIMARQIFVRFKALVMDPSAFTYAERHDNIEAIYKKLEERRDTADITEVLKALHRLVNEAIRAQDESGLAAEQPEPSRFYDLSQIDLGKLRDEFAKKVKRKATAIEDMGKIVEEKLAQMLARNLRRMDYYKRYSEIIADYNREKDRVTMEDTFATLLDLAADLDLEQQRAVKEGLTEDELALFDLLYKPPVRKATRVRLKLASKSLLESVTKLIAPLERWTEKEQTKALVEAEILDHLFRVLPSPPFTDEEKQAAAKKVYEHVWQQSAGGRFGSAAAA